MWDVWYCIHLLSVQATHRHMINPEGIMLMVRVTGTNTHKCFNFTHSFLTGSRGSMFSCGQIKTMLQTADHCLNFIRFFRISDRVGRADGLKRVLYNIISPNGKCGICPETHNTQCNWVMYAYDTGKAVLN